MPEGDTIHKHAVALATRFVGKPVDQLHARGRAYPELVGATISSVEARGKHLLVAVGEKVVVHVHLGINGSIHLTPASALPAWAVERASLVIGAGGVAAVVRRAATIELVRAAFLHAHPTLQSLGPDLLGGDVDIDAVVARVRTRTRAGAGASASAVGDMTAADMLLDQRIACGLGNVYKSELLFLERIDPWARVATFSDDTLARLYSRAVELLRGNLGPWRRTTTADLSRGAWIPRGRGRTHVYGRRGRPCLVCGTTIQSRRQGQQARMTYFCPRCQAAATPDAVIEPGPT